VLAVLGYPAERCRQLMEGKSPNPLAEPDAGNLVKLTDLILASPFGTSVDWRGDPIYEFIDPLIKIAAGYGVTIKAEYDFEKDLDGVTLIVRVGRKKQKVVGRTGPAEVALPSLAELGRGVEEASGGRIVTRVAAIYEPSDTWGYVMLSSEQWDEVREAVGGAFGRLFVE
jgi:hypothetical protein